jgi:hypothetical protein
MALTRFQRIVCNLLAENRIASGESYVAGGIALNELIGGARISRDVDVFHDTNDAVAASWRADRLLLEQQGFSVRAVRERPTFVEADVRSGDDSVRLEWARDSAFRFFPLQRHQDLGLTLHPFDLATNKVLALVGRLEVRDWVDVIASDARLQPVGYLAWAACAKDPGFSPASIVEGAARSSRYSAEEIQELSYSGAPPDAAQLGRAWHAILQSAREVIALLPPEEAGSCVLDVSGELFRGSPGDLSRALGDQQLMYHRGRLKGAYPQLKM